VIPSAWPVGSTPLIRAARLAADWGIHRLYLKNEAVNPTGSFKDRGAAVAVQHALAGGYRRVLTASSGNAGAALAAAAARAGLDCIIVADPGTAPTKLYQAKRYGATVRLEAGVFDQPPEPFIGHLRALSVAADAYLAFFWEPVNPVILKAFSAIADECIDALGQAPDAVLVPTGGGDLLVGQGRGYQAAWRAGRIPHVPMMVAVQPERAAPLVEAWERKLPTVPFRPHPQTIASGLRVAFSGNHALAWLQDVSGLRDGVRHHAVRVTDEQIRETVSLLATREGLWIEPSGAAGLAALPILLEQHIIRDGWTVVAILTGAGWKEDHA
jgi:threonine synthase